MRFTGIVPGHDTGRLRHANAKNRQMCQYVADLMLATRVMCHGTLSLRARRPDPGRPTMRGVKPGGEICQWMVRTGGNPFARARDGGPDHPVGATFLRIILVDNHKCLTIPQDINRNIHN